MSDIKLKPIAEGIIDDFINKKSKYDYRKLDYERVTSILQSRIKPIKIKHWGVYSVRFGKKFVAVPEIKLPTITDVAFFEIPVTLIVVCVLSVVCGTAVAL